MAASFSSLVTLIPPRYYMLQKDLGEEDTLVHGAVQSSRFHKNVRHAQPNKKEAAKAARVAKLNPANHLSVQDVTAARAVEAEDASSSEDGDESSHSDDEEYEDGSENEVLPFAVDDDDESDMEAKAGSKRKRTSENRDESDDDDNDDENDQKEEDDEGQNVGDDQEDKREPVRGNPSSGATITDLRARLHERIASLQKKRDASSEDNGTPESAEQLAERKRRGEMRDRRRKERKEARRAAIAASGASNAANTQHKNKPNDSIVRPAPGQAGGRNIAPALLVPEPSRAQEQQARQAFEIDTSASNVRYGGQVDADVQKLAEAHNLPRDPKTALNMLQARKAKAERKAEKKRAKHGETSEQEPDSVSSKPAGASDAAWEKATAAAAGVRVRDNEAMLQQAAARKDRAKKKGKAAWAERTKAVEESQAARQAKRQENIAIRQKSKKDRKPHPKDTRKTSSSSRPTPAGKAKSSRPQDKGKGGKGGKGGKDGKGGRK